ncbi:hypothetical protein IU459_11915 [Nocardia amamiensis]|uniref:ANTAR domain-containing protein n=1 Tax=Nocardia amamiensis TaxID=404578 RepID=A0ABS0CR20_9NOCA|nr:hypothetical protein [Nocardia amamiensis]MBF6298247.1 hypothetical protein [Nocardia amamiensis]
MSEPTIGQRLDTALDNLKLTTSAQGAIGWLVQGQAEKAQQALVKLDAEQLRAVSAAALGLAAMADHLANQIEENPTNG